MKRILSVVSAVALALLGGVVFIAAAPQAQDESKTEKLIKSLNEKVDKLEKRVAELEKKLAEKDPIAKMEERFKGLLDMLKGQFEGRLPGFFDGLDMDGLLDQFKEKLEKKPEPKKGAPRRRSI